MIDVTDASVGHTRVVQTVGYVGIDVTRLRPSKVRQDFPLPESKERSMKG